MRCSEASSSYNGAGAFEGTFDTDTYSVNSEVVPNKMFPLRVALFEDRIMTVEKKFFCDRTTEKTVYLDLYDWLGNQKWIRTRKVSCQYDLVKFTDLSFDHVENTKNNSWHVIQDFPTEDMMELGMPKIYKASAWVSEGDTLKFRVRFEEGSHVQVFWLLSVPSNEGDECKTGAGEAPELAETVPAVSFDEAEGVECKFPFRYDSVLYYGCTKIRISNETEDTIELCATSIDSDFNALKLGNCNSFCHRQRKCRYIFKTCMQTKTSFFCSAQT